MNRDTLNIFLNKDYRSLWVSNTGSNLAIWIQNMACAILVSHLSRSPLINSLVQVAVTLPFFLFGIAAGMVGDYLNKYKALCCIQLLMAVISLFLFFISLYGYATPWVFIILTFCFSVGTAFRLPIAQSSTVSLVQKEDIKYAAVMNNLGFNLSRTFGPALAGFIILFAPYQYLFLAVALLLCIAGLSFLPKSKLPQLYRNKKAIKQVKLKILFESKLYRLCCFDALILFFSGSIIWALMPYFSKHILHENPGGQGSLMAMIGVGALMTAFVLPPILKRFSRNTVVFVAYMLEFVSILLVFCFSKYGAYALFVPLAIFGLGWSISIASVNGIVQASFGEEIRTRALAIYLMAMYLAQTTGGLFFGSVSTAFSIAIGLILSLIVLFLGCCFRSVLLFNGYSLAK